MSDATDSDPVELLEQQYEEAKEEITKLRDSVLDAVRNAFKIYKMSFSAEALNEPFESQGLSNGNDSSEATFHSAIASTKLDNEVSKPDIVTSAEGALAAELATPFQSQPPLLPMITPKVKPNTPMALLRRPKQGEIAVSMQGSPLYVGGIVNETVANINIPLTDGNILSLQPNRGLRGSEVPELSADIKQQLQALYDNLATVCKKKT